MAQGSEDKQKLSIRVWTDMDIQEVKEKILLIDDLYGVCGNCKQVGLNYVKVRKCPSCGTEFKYLATSLTAAGEIKKILNRISKEQLGYTLIDREDFEKARSRDTLGSLFTH